MSLCLDTMHGILEYLLVKRINALEDSSGPPSFKTVWKITWGSCVMSAMNFLNKNNRVLSAFWTFTFNSLKPDCFWTKSMSSDAAVLSAQSFKYTSCKSMTYFFTTSSRRRLSKQFPISNMCLTPCCKAYFVVLLQASLWTSLCLTSSSCLAQRLERMRWPSLSSTVKSCCP